MSKPPFRAQRTSSPNRLLSHLKLTSVNLGNTLQNLGNGGNLGDSLNSMAGGGKQGEANEDYLDKGIDLVQQHVMGQGPQDNETAVEQAKDKAIAGVIRDRYQQTTGSEFPIKQKDQKFGGV